MSANFDPKWRADGRPRKTHCKHGHELTPENTYWHADGRRECRECGRISNRAHKQRLRDAGIKRKGGTFKPRLVKCPDCGLERMVKYRPATNRCRSCATTHTHGGRSPNYKTCPQCSREFYARPGQIRKYCSRACLKASGYLAAKLSAARQGKANPNYRDGSRVGEHISVFRLANKPGATHCRNCGAARNLHLHHVIPRSKYRAGIGELLNGLPLCRDCHLGWHYKRVTLYRDLFTEEEWAYLSSVELTGERIAPWLDKNYPVRPLEEAA